MMPKPTLLLTFLLTLFLLLSSSVQAGGCIARICGKIHNQTPWTLLYTTNPRPDDHCTSCCFFWNWHFLGKGAQQTTCTQLPLTETHTAGGSGVDVDGFTYADREYWYNGRKIKKGVWTKFATTQTVQCVNNGGLPFCN